LFRQTIGSSGTSWCESQTGTNYCEVNMIKSECLAQRFFNVGSHLDYIKYDHSQKTMDKNILYL